MSGHTPGPWETGKIFGGSILIRQEDREEWKRLREEAAKERLAAVHATTCPQCKRRDLSPLLRRSGMDPPKPRWICKIEIDSRRDEAIKNARLIAAAPDLLEAAKRIVFKMEAEEVRDGLPSPAELHWLRFAITKAERGDHA